MGVPVAGRNRMEVERLIGFFVNTLVLRCDLPGGPDGTPVRALVERLRETALDADAHQDLPFEKLVEELSPERSLSHTPLFQVMLAFQNLPREDFASEGLKATPLGIASGTAKFDLTLAVRANDERVVFEIEYSTELFDAPTVDRLAGHLTHLLEGALADPDRRVADLPLLSTEEARQIVEWNETAAAYPTDALPARADRGAGPAHAGQPRPQLRRPDADLPGAGGRGEPPRPEAPGRGRGTGDRRRRPGRTVAGDGGGPPRRAQGGRSLSPARSRLPGGPPGLHAGRLAGAGPAGPGAAALEAARPRSPGPAS